MKAQVPDFGFWGSKIPAAAGRLPTAADGRFVSYFSTFYSNRAGLRPNSSEVPRKSKLWALPLLSMFPVAYLRTFRACPAPLDLGRRCRIRKGTLKTCRYVCIYGAPVDQGAPLSVMPWPFENSCVRHCMFQSYFQWKIIINPSSNLHIRCLFWWKKEIYNFFQNG